MATGLRDATDFSAARLPNAAASMRPHSRAPADAQPEPVPSGVRTVFERFTSVLAWKANNPFDVAIAVAWLAFASRNPATNRSCSGLTPCADRTRRDTASARASASSVAVR